MNFELILLGISLIILIFVSVYGTIDMLKQISKLEDQEQNSKWESEND